MTKKEFSKTLFDALSEEMSKEEIYSHIRYYEEYIENEKKSGVLEEDVISKLGNPRLLAKTILNSSRTNGYTGETYSEKEEKPKLQKKTGILIKIKRVLITILICVLLFFFLRVGFILFWKFGMPIIVIVWLIRLVYKVFK